MSGRTSVVRLRPIVAKAMIGFVSIVAMPPTVSQAIPNATEASNVATSANGDQRSAEIVARARLQLRRSEVASASLQKEILASQAELDAYKRQAADTLATFARLTVEYTQLANAIVDDTARALEESKHQMALHDELRVRVAINRKAKESDFWDTIAAPFDWFANTLIVDHVVRPVFKYALRKPGEFIADQTRRSVMILVNTTKDTFWTAAAVATGDWSKAGRKSLGVVGDLVDAGLAPLDATNGLVTMTLEVIPVMRLFGPWLMEDPEAVCLHKEFPGTAIYYINGVNQDYEKQKGDAEFISVTLRRPVYIIHDWSEGVITGGAKKLGERLFPVPGINQATRQVAWVIAHKPKGEKLNFLTFSGGAIVCSNAFAVASQLGYGDTVRRDCCLVAGGCPIRPEEVHPKPARFVMLPGSQDFVHNGIGVDGWREGWGGKRGHDSQSYTKDIDAMPKSPFFE